MGNNTYNTFVALQISKTHFSPVLVYTPTNMSDHHYKFNVTMTCGGCSGAIERVLKKLDEQVSKITTSLSTPRPQTSPPLTRCPTRPCSRRLRRPARRSTQERPMELLWLYKRGQ